MGGWRRAFGTAIGCWLTIFCFIFLGAVGYVLWSMINDLI